MPIDMLPTLPTQSTISQEFDRRDSVSFTTKDGVARILVLAPLDSDLLDRVMRVLDGLG